MAEGQALRIYSTERRNEEGRKENSQQKDFLYIFLVAERRRQERVEGEQEADNKESWIGERHPRKQGFATSLDKPSAGEKIRAR